MSKLLFRMRNVPADEAEEVRALLQEHEIEFFETHAGNWGISMPGLWVMRDEQLGEARLLLDAYQAERSARVRQDYAMSRERGEAKTLWHSFCDNPFRFVGYTGLALAIMYLSVRFFLTL